MCAFQSSVEPDHAGVNSLYLIYDYYSFSLLVTLVLVMSGSYMLTLFIQMYITVIYKYHCYLSKFSVRDYEFTKNVILFVFGGQFCYL